MTLTGNSSVSIFRRSYPRKKGYFDKWGKMMNACHAAYWRRHLHILGALMLAPFFLACYYAGFWLRFEGNLRQAEWQLFCQTVCWIVALKAAWFVGLGVCRGWRRAVTFYDLIVLLKAVSGATVTAALIQYLLGPLPTIPRSVFLLDWGTTIVTLGGVRALTRGVREARWSLFNAGNRTRVLIAGAGETGASLVRSIRRLDYPQYDVVGFIDSEGTLAGGRIEGLPVSDARHRLVQLIERHRVRQILVVQGEFAGSALRQLLEDARSAGCEVRVVPNYRQLIEGTVTIQPRPVEIEDLLQREPVDLDINNIRQWIDGRTIMVTGSAGSIGSEICRQLLRFDPERLVAVDRAETGQFFLERELQALAGDKRVDVCLADVLAAPRMRRLLMHYRPDVIFHAAAYKHVPLMESHPQEAVTNIVTATHGLADLAAEYRAESFVMISTDKAVNPTSVMGACKRVAELYVQSLAGRSSTRFVTVRFGNVLDSAGSVVQLFRQQIAAGGPITITDPEIRRFFMTIPEASQLVIQAGAIGEDGQILLLDMGQPVRIVDLATDMIRLSGLTVGEDIAIEYVGLRPGEKLFEELHIPGERLLPTSHPKIIVAACKPPKVSDIRGVVKELERLAVEAPEAIVEQLTRIVCGYEHPASRSPWRQLAA